MDYPDLSTGMKFELAYCWADEDRDASTIEALKLPKKPKGFVKKHGAYPLVAAEAVRLNDIQDKSRVRYYTFFPSPLVPEKVGG